MAARPTVLAGLALVLTGAVISGTLPGAGAAAPEPSAFRGLVGSDAAGLPGREIAVGDADRRGPALLPLPQAQRAVAALGSDLSVSWTQYGTVKLLSKTGGYVARNVAGSTPTERATAFLRSSAALFGLSAADIGLLEVRSALPLPQTTEAHVVTFQQRMGGHRLVETGLIGVGLRGDDVAIVTSSAVGASTLGQLSATTPRLDARQAVLAAAVDGGIKGLSLSDLELSTAKDSADFTLVKAAGLHQLQKARLAVLPTTDRGARLVWETDVIDVAGSHAHATMSYVDAVSGAVLLRRDGVDTFAEGTRTSPAMRSIRTAAPAAAPTTGTFTGEFTVDACGPKHLLDVDAGAITVAVAVAASPSNDTVVKIFRNGVVVVTGDTGTSPEAATAQLIPPATATDKIEAQVCPFDDASIAPFNYVGTYFTTDQGATAPPLPGGLLGDGSLLGPATWRVFSANPELPTGDAASKDDRDKVCATTHLDKSAKAAGCNINGYTYFDNSPFPYDVDGLTGLPTFTTAGNNALTSNAQASSSLTPGGPFLPPVSPTRDYAPAFTDSWHTTKCNPTTIANPVDRANIDAAIVTLFVGHNRMHDFSYRLGLTEPRGAMQVTNFGKGGAEADPEVGNAQNAALSSEALETATQNTTGPAAGVGLTGRNNANQVTLQDGTPGITNQYLFQPVLGFYAPCTDGDLDGSIFIHEYTHAISNRLIAGPEAGLAGEQGRSMGESWSDLVAVEYLNAFGLAGKRGEDPFSVGAYATGDPYRGIRDFNVLVNPLNYSDFGFDATGPEFHADGEIWNGIQAQVRAALNKKYDAQFPSTNLALQAACALGRTTTGAVQSSFEGCPGSRRWVTHMFDSMILMQNPEPTMVDMKDAQLASDMMRTGGKDQEVIAAAFARGGIGGSADAVNGDDTDPTPGFDAPKPFTAGNSRVTFSLVDDETGKPVKGDVHVGVFQARTTPVASTIDADPGPTATMVRGTYQLVVRAPGYGLQRFALDVPGGGAVTKKLALARNVASRSSGAIATAPGWIRLSDLVDDDEGTNAGFDGSADAKPVAGQTVTIALSGTKTVRSIAVSALHRPVKPAAEDQPADFQGRLLGLHEFDVQASSDGGKTYKTVYSSPEQFFSTGPPRAVAPDLNLRTVNLPTAVRADHLKLVVRSNTCTGTPQFRGDQDNDPTANADCPSTVNANKVTVTEFQAFGTAAAAVTGPASGPIAAPRPQGPRTLAATGGSVTAATLGLLLLLGCAFAVRRRTT